MGNRLSGRGRSLPYGSSASSAEAQISCGADGQKPLPPLRGLENRRQTAARPSVETLGYPRWPLPGPNLDGPLPGPNLDGPLPGPNLDGPLPGRISTAPCRGGSRRPPAGAEEFTLTTSRRLLSPSYPPHLSRPSRSRCVEQRGVRANPFSPRCSLHGLAVLRLNLGGTACPAKMGNMGGRTGHAGGTYPGVCGVRPPGSKTKLCRACVACRLNLGRSRCELAGAADPTGLRNAVSSRGHIAACVHKGERRPSGAAALRNAGQSNHRSLCSVNEPMQQEKTQPSLVERIAVYSLTGTVPGSMKRIDCRNSLTCFKSSSLATVVKRVRRHDPQRKITSCKWRPSGSS